MVRLKCKLLFALHLSFLNQDHLFFLVVVIEVIVVLIVLHRLKIFPTFEIIRWLIALLLVWPIWRLKSEIIWKLCETYEEYTLRNYYFYSKYKNWFYNVGFKLCNFRKEFQLWDKRNSSWTNMRIVDFSFDIWRWRVFAPLSLMLMVSLITIILITINIIMNIISMCIWHILAIIIIIIFIIIIIRILTILYMVLSLLLSALSAFSSTSSTFWWNEFWKNYPTTM